MFPRRGKLVSTRQSRIKVVIQLGDLHTLCHFAWRQVMRSPVIYQELTGMQNQTTVFNYYQGQMKSNHLLLWLLLRVNLQERETASTCSANVAHRQSH